MTTDALRTLRRRVRSLIRRHPAIYGWVRLLKYGPMRGLRRGARRRQLAVRARAEGWRVLNLGSGGRFNADALNLDITLENEPDVVGDGHALPFPDATFEAVFCEFVIEHVKDPEEFLAGISRTLKPSGFFYLSVPFMQPGHGYGGDFTRWTRAGFSEIAARAGLEVSETGIVDGPAFTLYWVLRESGAMTVSLGWGPLYRVSNYVLGWLLAPVLLLDVVLLRVPQANILASSFYVIGGSAAGNNPGEA